MRTNFFGGPGVGKSHKAAEFYLKNKCKLVREFVKPMAWRNEEVLGWDCVNTFSCQLKRELEILDYTDIVTDSPLLLQVVYAKRNNCPVWRELLEIALEFDKDFDCVNYLIPRGAGRFQALQEARVIDIEIIDFLKEYGVKYDVLFRTA